VPPQGKLSLLTATLVGCTSNAFVDDTLRGSRVESHISGIQASAPEIKLSTELTRRGYLEGVNLALKLKFGTTPGLRGLNSHT
jgi:hypothetical protein